MNSYCDRDEYEFIFLKNDMNSQDKVGRYEFNGGDGQSDRTYEFNGMQYGGKKLTHAMVVANSTSTYPRMNDRWSGLIVQVRTKLCGHLNQKRSIRVGMISSMKMTTDRAQQHNSTTAQAETEQKISMY